MSEAFYDEQIAPELARIGKLCQENGISLIAAAEWAPGEYGETTTLQTGSSFAIRLIQAAVKSNGNIDALMLAVTRYAREHGHSSMYLSKMGVPTSPEKLHS